MAVVLSSLVDLFGGKVLQVVDGFFYSFDALIHAFVWFFLELFVLSLEDLTAISQFLR